MQPIGGCDVLFDRARVAAALPSYNLGEELGSGAFGVVVRAHHRHLDRPVAVKVVHVADDEARRRFVAEARLLAAIDHPHIVRVYDYVEADPLCLIVMELLDGGTLTRRQTMTSPPAACAVGLGIAAALACAHTRGVLHRDVKPDNVLFGACGLPKTTDFGIAKAFAGTETTASMVAGTPRYMAPEQIVQGQLGPGTDIYALGVVLYELLAGRPMFDPGLPLFELYNRTLHASPGPLDRAPASVAKVIMRALAKDRTDRQPDARTFAVDLAHAATLGFGPGWASRSGIQLQLDDDVRAAIDVNADVAKHARQPQRSESAAAPKPPTPPIPARVRPNTAQPIDRPGPERPATPPAAMPSRARPSRAMPSRAMPSPAPSPIASPFPRKPTRAAARSPIASSSSAAAPADAAPADPAPADPAPADGAPADAAQEGIPTEPAGHTKAVIGLTFAGDGRLLASSGQDGLVVLWDVTDGRPGARKVGSFFPHDKPVEAFGLSPDGRVLATARLGSVILWDLRDPAHPVKAAEFAPGADILALRFSHRPPAGMSVIDHRPAVTSWDVRDPRRPKRVAASVASDRYDHHLNVADLSPDGWLLAVSSHSHDVFLLLVAGSGQLRTAASLRGTHGAGDLSFSADGGVLAVNERLGQTSLWDVTKPSSPRRRNTMTIGASVRFSPTGRVLATASLAPNAALWDESHVTLWDASDLKYPRRLASLAARGSAVAFTADVTRLATAAHSGRGIIIWPVDIPGQVPSQKR